MKAFITGGAGCIGSELAARLLSDGHEVTVFDNLSSGKEEHVFGLTGNENFRFIKADILDLDAVKNAVKGCDVVFHLAANSDIKYTEGDPTDEDLKLNIVATYNVLEAMRTEGIKKILFTSSSAVYGEASRMPTPEDEPLRPISLYGASKASCESLISGFCHMFGMQAWIVRLANIIGPKSRRTGKTVITDFIERLRAKGNELLILGDGRQSKSYLLVGDCVEGMLAAFRKSNEKVNIFNVGPEDFVTVNDIARMVTEEMSLSGVRFVYSGGDRGWTGDVPKFLLDTARIRKLGWKPMHMSAEAVRLAIKAALNG